MTGLTAEQQFELRAKKALEQGNTSFKPRGANKELFEKIKEEFEKKTNKINSHTSSEADRVIRETAGQVMLAVKQNTQPLPGQVAMAAKLASSAVKVCVLNSILEDKGITCKGVKAD